LLTRDEAETLCRTAIEASRADETEVVLGGGRLSIVRLEDGAVRENRSESRFEVRIRVQHRGRTGLARTNRLDPESVKRAAGAANEAALAGTVRGLLPLPGPTTYLEPKTYDPEVTSLPPAARLGLVAPLVLDARRHGAHAAGLFAARGGSLGPSGAGVLAIANSHGLFAFHRTTRLRLDARVRAGGGSGWGEAEHWRARDFDPAPAVSRALAKALAAREPKTLAAGEYEVVLEPAAVAAFLRVLAPHFSAHAVEEGWSFLRGREGRAVAQGNITLLDDPGHPLHVATPFDGEGAPRTKVPLLVRGVVRGLVYSREMARRAGVPATGHAPLRPSRVDALPEHFVLQGEERSAGEVLGTCERGILVTRIEVHGLADPWRAVAVGVTRDGTFWIEGGKVRHTLADLRFEMSAFDVLAYAALLSRPERALGVVAPAMRVRRFRVLGAAA
jgi:predicted Zn-dependent protease